MTLPNRNIFDGTLLETPTGPFTSTFKGAMGNLRDYLAGLLGTTGAPADALAVLGLSSQPTFRNKIINGDMRIDQRNGGAAQTLTAGNTYTVDRWFAVSVGANTTGQRVAGSGASQYRYQITGASGATSIQFAQRLEAQNTFDLANGVATLSVDLANSLLTSVGYIVSYAASGTDNWGSNTTIASGTFTVNSMVSRYSVPITLPAGATTGIQIQFYTANQTSGTFTIGNVQFEKGSVATPFEYVDQQVSLARCQRYYETGLDRNAIMWSGMVTSLSNYYSNKGFSVSKRVAPTIGLSSETISNFGAGYPTTQSDITGFQTVKQATATAPNGFYFYNWAASAEL